MWSYGEVRLTPRSWTLRVLSPGGGVRLAEDTDRYLNIAPFSGYQQELLLSGRVHPHQPLERHTFYFVTEGEEAYGLVSLEPHLVKSDPDSVPEIILSYKVNLEGRRDLQVKGWQWRR